MAKCIFYTIYLNFKKLSVMMHACNLRTWEIETGGLEVESQPWLLRKFKVRLAIGDMSLNK